ncbi:MAG: SDR family NAD(P)-dependent oxidoreductase [SAR202 cluster bacterium]|jgi:3-oxoacyl-[acyl-carrier protein] reductase|nr:SDR family NAD(P)-dependent oxidoreductase [SAR202 cluster bacterium]MDP6301040.1 SDR family NAD(P)-dependent oxidoreductase [SAR202 cluster bacterium]MDP7104502.1 SDR family NAD(P)-dependent oxidoreductase [SAR202 cluster bacterium]MDP7226165.1 SDR family NAD(P)-dependent oxidoreductase [SAR202 cluster bacterium]HJO81045.1 SDR family NAD(P)-dependent oxidoreductase [SAR202 cluster bacterium]
MTIDFTGKTAIVTGAAHGIGQAITHGLASRGATVWATDIAEIEASDAPAGGGRVVTRVVDVTDKGQLASLVSEASAESGRVDILVCVAGGVRGQVGQPIEDVTEEQWHAIYEVNLKGAFLSAQAVVPGMKAAGAGRILVISSGAGLGVSLTGIQAYGSAKAGQIGLVRQLAHELGQRGITVNSVAPGLVRSNPDSEAQWLAMGDTAQRQLVDSIPLRRLGQAEDIANAVMFLVSDMASYVTGQTLSVNGGR